MVVSASRHSNVSMLKFKAGRVLYNRRTSAEESTDNFLLLNK